MAVKSRTTTIYYKGTYTDREIMDLTDKFNFLKNIKPLPLEIIQTVNYYVQEQFVHRNFSDSELRVMKKMVMGFIKEMQEQNIEISLINLKKLIVKQQMHKMDWVKWVENCQKCQAPINCEGESVEHGITCDQCLHEEEKKVG